ncbi:MAG: aldo/keto reductase [Pseudomonadota bacterium]
MTALDVHRRIRLGRTDLRVTKLCFGTSALGDAPNSYGYHVDEDRAKATLHRIFEGPVNFLDTSRNYGMGRSEERIGQVIHERGGVPEGFVISTKLDADDTTGRFDAAQARRSLAASAKALGIDHFPLLHLHDPEHARSLDELLGDDGGLRELFRMRDEGSIGAIGLAGGDVAIMMPILRDWDFDVLITHNRFTLTNRNAEPMIDLAVAKGTAVLNAAPYCGGVLAKGLNAFPRYVYQDLSEPMRQAIERIETVCADNGVPTGAAALQFSLRDTRITSTICGVSRPERVQETLEWATWPIADEVWAALTALPFTTDDPEAARPRTLA